MIGIKERVAAGVLAATICATLGGCSREISLGPSEYDIPLCAHIPAQIPVAALNKQKRATCSRRGTLVVFPDGTSLRVRENSFGRTIASNTEKRDYYVAELGIYGIVATEKVDNQKRRWWGSLTGVHKVKAACTSDCS